MWQLVETLVAELAEGHKLPEEPGEQLLDAMLGAMIAGKRSEREILGSDGVFGELTRRLVERALDEELTEHLGYAAGLAPPGGQGTPAYVARDICEPMLRPELCCARVRGVWMGGDRARWRNIFRCARGSRGTRAAGRARGSALVWRSWGWCWSCARLPGDQPGPRGGHLQITTVGAPVRLDPRPARVVLGLRLRLAPSGN